MTIAIITIAFLALWIIGLSTDNGRLKERARLADEKAAHLQRLVDMCRQPGVN